MNIDTGRRIDLFGARLRLSIVVVVCLTTCEERNAKFTAWQYPIHFGDSRAKVHEVLGSPSRVTSELEEYLQSGVTVWRDPEQRVTKLGFSGPAGATYGQPPSVVPNHHQVVFGLTPRASEVEFKRRFGTPSIEFLERSSGVRERRCIWKRGRYVVDALFLATSRTHDGRLYSEGALLWFEVYRAV